MVVSAALALYFAIAAYGAYANGRDWAALLHCLMFGMNVFNVTTNAKADRP
jgi:hypothetical protein